MQLPPSGFSFLSPVQPLATASSSPPGMAVESGKSLLFGFLSIFYADSGGVALLKAEENNSKLGACRGVPTLGSFADFSWPQQA